MLTGEHGPSTLAYLLLLALPLSALIARRVPLLRTLWIGMTWVVLFGVLLFVTRQRAQFDPLMTRAAKLLHLDDQSVVGREVRINMSEDGHFWARSRIGGADYRMLIDSGATVTALSTATASAAGLQVSDSVFPMEIRTANGTVTAKVQARGVAPWRHYRTRSAGGRVTSVRRHRCAGDELPIATEKLAGRGADVDPRPPPSRSRLYIMYIIGPVLTLVSLRFRP